MRVVWLPLPLEPVSGTAERISVTDERPEKPLTEAEKEALLGRPLAHGLSWNAFGEAREAAAVWKRHSA
jgi:hypothetical protein